MDAWSWLRLVPNHDIRHDVYFDEIDVSQAMRVSSGDSLN